MFTAVKRRGCYCFLISKAIIHVNMETSVRIYKILAECKYIFRSLKLGDARMSPFRFKQSKISMLITRICMFYDVLKIFL